VIYGEDHISTGRAGEYGLSCMPVGNFDGIAVQLGD